MSSPDEIRLSARQTLVRVLRTHGPQLGSRLKIRLFDELRAGGCLDDGELQNAIPRLKPFLAANIDLVEIKKDRGDITVALRGSESPATDAETAPRAWFRSDVWQAFLNPDPRRRRFLHRNTGQVVHFLADSTLPPNSAIARRVQEDSGFVEINQVSATTQTGWMEEFLGQNSVLPEWTQKTARHFLSVPFESSVNDAFAVALRSYAGAWKTFRSAKAEQTIKAWAATNGISEDLLSKSRTATSSAPAGDTGDRRTASDSSHFRRTLHRLADLLELHDLERIHVPASVVVRLLRDVDEG